MSKIKRYGQDPGWDTDELIERACYLASHGATDAEIAQHLKVNVFTIYDWYTRYPQFLKAVREGKGIFDDRIERTLAQRATGFYIEEEKVFSNGTRAKVMTYVPPDTTAMIFWLKNRRHVEWRDRKELELPPPETGEGEATPIRQLAMGVLAILAAAAYAPPDKTATIEARPVTPTEPETEEKDDDFDID